MALRIGRSRLPEHLQRIGMSQTEYASRIGLSDSMISRIISGQKQLSVVKMKESADLFGCNMDDLCYWEVVQSKRKRSIE